MTAMETSRRRVGEERGAGTQLVEAMGRAHYERMRAGMAGVLDLPTWDDLPPLSRESHRRRVAWLLPALLPFVVSHAADGS